MSFLMRFIRPNVAGKVIRRAAGKGRGGRRSFGFTLLETAMATIIVGVGTTAVVQLMGKGTVANDSAAEMTTAVNLGNCIHELTQGMASFTDSSNHWGLSGSLTKFNVPYVVGLDGQSFNPPVDARRQVLSAANYATWTQAISIQSVDSNNIKFNEPSNNPTTWPMARVTVTVSHNGKQICSQSWLMVRTQ